MAKEHQYKKFVLKNLKKSFPSLKVFAGIPKCIKKYRWRPDIIFKQGNNYLFFDLILSGSIPQYQYKNIVKDNFVSKPPPEVIDEWNITSHPKKFTAPFSY